MQDTLMIEASRTALSEKDFRRISKLVQQYCGVNLHDGKEALQIIADEWIDVALVDINMPVMTGDELIDALRADPETAKFPIIVVSSESSEKRIELLKAKGTEFVHKPFTPESVREAIVELTGVTYEHASEAEDIQGGGLDF